MAYDIVSIPEDAREDTEQLGSKPKFWVALDGERWLFKEARENTGEDWAEKVAAELASALEIPSARVELAEYCGRRGCISHSFMNADAGEALVHGNEILAFHVTGYDRTKTFNQSDHTVHNVVSAIQSLLGSATLVTPMLTTLASYMVLDALIGNTDRHHENWGLLVHVDGSADRLRIAVAPSYDHASSLGRELLDARRTELLQHDSLERYVARGRGGIFQSSDDSRGANPLRLVETAAVEYPHYFRSALLAVQGLSGETIGSIVNALPEERASTAAKQFALAMILTAQRSLNRIPR
ncbi:HipA domain-containing protein [Roseateles sp.]|uniref:HipA domain-containing protein n=1 Tax=Roseateles sp. TaxID=1971397 RepID=UPI0031E13CC9